MTNISSTDHESNKAAPNLRRPCAEIYHQACCHPLSSHQKRIRTVCPSLDGSLMTPKAGKTSWAK